MSDPEKVGISDPEKVEIEPVDAIKHEEEAKIVELRMKKSRCKASYTRAQNTLKDELDDEIDKDRAKQLLDKVEEKMDEVLDAIQTLGVYYKEKNRTDDMVKVSKEIDIAEKQYDDIVELYHESFGKSVTSGASVVDVDISGGKKEFNKEEKQISSDLWKQLKRVSIPVFYGDKTKYPAWKAAFYGCVDQAPSSPEYKMLQLRQYLGGEALKSIENLGHSAEAYVASKERLERKFGGTTRIVNRFLEELEMFIPMRNESAKELEKFADLLDVAVINLKEAKHVEDLKDGSLYRRLLKKLPQTMLTRYNRQLNEKGLSESVETLRYWINQETEYAVRANETIHGMISTEQNGQKLKSYFSNNVQKDSRQIDTCKVCGKTHKIWKCPMFEAMNVEERWAKAKEKKLCYRCLKSNHLGSQCRFQGKCGLNGCEKTHNRLLHREMQELNVKAKTFEPCGTPQVFNASNNNYIALRTIPVILKVKGKEIKINALLDDGSTKSYINEDVVSEMGLSGEKSYVEVNVINGKTERFETTNVDFVILSENRNMTMNMEAQTIKNVTGKLKPIDWQKNAKNWPHLQSINFPKVTKKCKIDLLIGLDYVELHRSLGEVQGEKGEPVARLTPLGWTCVGPIDNGETSFFTFKTELNTIDQTIQKFWQHENEGLEMPSKLSLQDQQILTKTEASVRFENDHYSIEVPWKENNVKLADNYEMAKRRLISTERRLDKDPVVKDIYRKTIEGYVKKGYVEKVDTNSLKERQWLLPHFPVVRLNKETTKVRIVFDASVRYQDVSLNDLIHPGPKLQNSLFDVLMRFRKEKIALASDVQEMYLRIGMIPSDRKFHRFLWRSSPDEEPEEYEFQRLVFGVSSSPFLAQLVSQHNAKLYENNYPRAAETVLRSTYMDDSMDSVESDEKGIQLYEELTGLWEKAGMHAHKWMSNSRKVLEHIPLELRAMKADLTKNELPKTKTLGVLWEAEDDSFKFEYTPVERNNRMTKREYLKTIATLFDPLGLLAPYIVRAKMMMQDIWLAGIDWDEEIPNETMKKITHWFGELSEVSQIQIPRCLKDEKKVTEMTVHSFSDASIKAYGTVVYARNKYEDGDVSVRLIAAKSRVAPMSALSTPRLELMAAVLSLELTKAVKDALEIDITKCTFWTDSMDVVYWLRNQSRVFKPFVANRVAEIQRNTNPGQWQHVPGEMNPADLVSRGVKAQQLVEDRFWWEGPDFLKKDETEWPKTPIKGTQPEQKEVKKSKIEQVKTVNANFNVSSSSIEESSDEKETMWKLNPLRFSCWKKLNRIMAWVLRFIENCRTKREDRKFGELSCDELKDTDQRLIRDAQVKEFSEYKDILHRKQLPKNSKLLPLNPVIDTEGIVRSNSRLQYAEFIPFDSRHPVILPRRSWVTKLIVKSVHESGNHAGTNFILSMLSSKYWIIHAREVIREVERECLVCKRQKTTPVNQIMAPLPSCRLGVPMKAFANISIDYGGPFVTIQGRGKSRQKRYLCLFTCLATRAVHLEMSYGLDTGSFLNAFFRMVSRRGLPQKVISDNGTNFVGANKELKSLTKALDEQQIVRNTADKGIKWQFNPPLAPHWGGVHEIMIKAAKRAVYSILKGADVTDEELTTAFVGAESLINSRPLTYQSSNAADCVPITPNHFLFGQMGGEFAPQSVDTTPFHLRNRWRRVQELMRHFWQRWLKEWLPNLASRKKWFQEQRELAEGDVVLVVSLDTPRGQWPLGRIITVYRGIDGHIRSATVLVRGKKIDRPITKLCPLECEK